MNKIIEQEVERKFLLHAVPQINYDSIIRIKQAYKSDRPERIRQEEIYPRPRKPIENFWLAENPKLLYEHTLKETLEGKEGVQETNQQLNESKFNDLIPMFPNIIKKIRHVKSCKINVGMKWEIDDFSLHRTEMVSIIVAEIEVPSLNYDIQFPEWLKPYILKEITDDKTYSNFKLAQRNMYSGNIALI